MLDTSLQLWKSYLGILTGVNYNYSMHQANGMLHQQTCYLIEFSKMQKLQPSFWPHTLVWSEFGFAEAQHASLSNQPGNFTQISKGESQQVQLAHRSAVAVLTLALALVTNSWTLLTHSFAASNMDWPEKSFNSRPSPAAR